MKETQVRYGRDENGQPKNTLWTINKGDIIYFGIARCRTEEDAVVKNEGKRRAKARAEAAVSNVADGWEKDGTLAVHKSGLFGQVDRGEVIKLLKYFDDIDVIAYERALDAQMAK